MTHQKSSIIMPLALYRIRVHVAFPGHKFTRFV
jgi:hypothetical protein